MPASFVLFSSLAAELRNQIWRDALPHHIGPTLYSYRKRGCWCPRRLTESEPGYIAGNDDLNLAFEFRTELLDDDNQYHVPLFSVNREARSIVIAWLQEHNIKIRPQESGEHLFVRPFNAEYDALYVPLARWEEFCLEPSERMLEPDLQDISVDLGSDLTKIAVSENLFWKTDLMNYLPEMEVWFEHLKVLFVVMGSQPDEMKGPWRWELQGTDGGAFIWTGDSEEFTFRKGNETFIQEEVYKRMEEAANKGLRQDLINSGLKSLEVRPVFAVRR